MISHSLCRKVTIRINWTTPLEYILFTWIPSTLISSSKLCASNISSLGRIPDISLLPASLEISTRYKTKCSFVLVSIWGYWIKNIFSKNNFIPPLFLITFPPPLLSYICLRACAELSANIFYLLNWVHKWFFWIKNIWKRMKKAFRCLIFQNLFPGVGILKNIRPGYRIKCNLTRLHYRPNIETIMLSKNLFKVCSEKQTKPAQMFCIFSMVLWSQVWRFILTRP